MNTLAATHKSRAVAKALNNPGGHAKSAEKGQSKSHKIPRKIGGVDNRKL